MRHSCRRRRCSTPAVGARLVSGTIATASLSSLAPTSMLTAAVRTEPLTASSLPISVAPLPFEDGTFDVVYSNFVIEHLSRPEAAFGEWRRVLAVGGALIVVTSNRANPLLAAAGLLPGRTRLTLKRRGAGAVERDVFPTLYRANTPERLASLLVEAGFEAVATSYVATLHRYAARLRPLDSLLRLCERILPERRRSTIVAWYRAV